MSSYLAVVSGGLDSTTLAYYLNAEGQLGRMLSVDYGQRHRKELEFAAATAQRLGVPWELVDLSGITNLIASSSLTSERIDVPDGHYAEESMRATVVPNRNMMMMSIAAAVAIANDLDGIAVGVHAGDHFIYPDCRPEFIDAMSLALRLGNAGFAPAGFQVHAPFVNITKTDIAVHAGDLRVPIDETWSCYKGGDRHCGRCGTCVERQEALHDAELIDPTEYEDRDFWRTAGRVAAQ